MSRVRRVDPNTTGITRRRQGRGFAYKGPRGSAVDDETRHRIHALAIPPAWSDVWVSVDPLGHIQATGIDAAGRKQYIYHEAWRQRRDREKYRRVEGFGRSLPPLRRRVTRDLGQPGLGRDRVLAGAVRLLDRSALRIGGEEYARRNGTYGLATLQRDHVQLSGDGLELRFHGKTGKEHVLQVRDGSVARLVRELDRMHKRELLGWCEGDRWHDVRAHDINEYLRGVVGEDYSAKDFRTWNATVLAASTLASHEPREGRRAVTTVIKQVAEELGNTPAVCRSSYVDPRVIDRFLDEGRTIQPASRGRRAAETAVLELLAA